MAQRKRSGSRSTRAKVSAAKPASRARRRGAYARAEPPPRPIGWCGAKHPPEPARAAAASDVGRLDYPPTSLDPYRDEDMEE